MGRSPPAGVAQCCQAPGGAPDPAYGSRRHRGGDTKKAPPEMEGPGPSGSFEFILNSNHAEANSAPIAFIEFIGVAMLLPTGCHPHRTRTWRQFPMSGHPFVPLVAPRPITGEPQMLRRRLGQHNFLLQRGWSLGHDNGVDRGHGGRGRIGGIAHDYRDRSRGGGGHDCSGRFGGRRGGNDVRFRFGSTTGKETKGAATGEECGERPGRTNGGRTSMMGNCWIHPNRIRCRGCLRYGALPDWIHLVAATPT